VNITVNYLAVVVAAAVSFVLGMIWHGPLFGKAWAASRGITPEQMATGKKGMARQALAIFICLLVVAWALAVIANYVHLVTVMQGIKLGVVCWIGFSVTTSLVDYIMTTGRKSAALYIDVGSWLITFVVSGIIVSYWH